uniref:Uncharacterized protein n=1 Tax=Rhizophora mucronata TaxID=61149 RepID=A0A2P2R2U0_RHIMU
MNFHEAQFNQSCMLSLSILFVAQVTHSYDCITEYKQFERSQCGELDH